MIETTSISTTGEEAESAVAQLIRQCRNGEESAWEELVSRYERLIFSVSLKICRDREIAADVLQQVFMELYQRLDELRSIPSLPGWMATVSRRKTCDHLRSLRPTEPFEEENHIDSIDSFMRIEQQHTLERALATLPERNRRLMYLLYISPEDYSYEEIAAELRMPVASIGPTRTRCLKRLKKLLD